MKTARRRPPKSAPRPLHLALSDASGLRWALLALSAAALYACWPLWPALVLAAWTAALGRPLLLRFERGLRGRRRAAAALSLLFFLGLLLPLGLVGLGIVSGARELWDAVSQTSSVKSALEAIAAGTGGAPTVEVPTSFNAVLELFERFGAQGVGVLTSLAGAAARGVVGLVVYVGGAFIFMLEGPALWSWLQRRAPLAPAHLERLGAAFHETGRGLLVGVGLTSATQGLVATIIYASLGVPRWWVLGPLTGLASVVPLVGTALIWGPISLGLFLTGHPIKGAILLALGLVVIGSVDNLLRPLFARLGSLKLPMFLVFVAALGGIAAWGPWGALLGPIVVRLWMEAVELYREAQGSGAVAPAPPGPAPTVGGAHLPL